jgi:hypothetical protein
MDQQSSQGNGESLPRLRDSAAGRRSTLRSNLLIAFWLMKR